MAPELLTHQIRWRSVVLGAVILGLSLTTGCASAPAVVTASTTPLPVEAVTLTGERVALGGDGVAQLLVFWQPWCKSCKADALAVEAASQQHKELLSVIGICVGERPADEVARKAQAWGMSFAQIHDNDALLADRFGVRGTPTLILLSGTTELYRGHRLPEDLDALLGAATAPACEDGVCPIEPIESAVAQPIRRANEKTGPSKILSDPPPADLKCAKRRYGAMGTEIVIEAYGQNEQLLEEAVDAAVRELSRIETKMTSWDERSELSSINLSAGIGPVAVSDELYAIVERALYISELTSGAFDITWAAAHKLWDYKAREPKLPTDNAVQDALSRIGWHKVVLDKDAHSVFLPVAGMRMTLGGIAKGYAVDRAMGILKEHDVRCAMVNAGGDLRVLGKREQRSWRIGIVDPRAKDKLLAVIPVANTAVVTSGDYERYVEIDGVRYHHIIDPRTARPASGTMSVTVIAHSAELADGLSTGVFVLGPEKGLALVDRIREAEAVVVDDKGRIHFSSGLEKANSVQAPAKKPETD